MHCLEINLVNSFVRSEILKSVTVQNTVVWDVTPYEIHWREGGGGTEVRAQGGNNKFALENQGERGHQRGKR